MSSPSEDASFIAGRNMMYITFTLVVQTFFFGAYTILIIISTRMHLQRGLKKRSIMALFFIGLFMYIVSAAYWAYSVADVVGRMQIFIAPTNAQYILFNKNVTTPFNLFNAIVLVNFVLSDGIVIWRGWAVCARNHRKYLAIPIAFLCITVVSTFGLIGIKSAAIAAPQIGSQGWFTEVINVLQVANMAMSLFSNISATTIIGITAWRHRRTIQASFRADSKATQILLLLVESGLIYCIATGVGMAGLLVRLPARTLNDLYLPVHIQIAGSYAPAILLLVNSQAASDQTEYLGSMNSANASATPSRTYGAPPPRARAAPPQRTVLSTIQFAAESGSPSESSEFGDKSEWWSIPIPPGLSRGRSFATDLEMNIERLSEGDYAPTTDLKGRL